MDYQRINEYLTSIFNNVLVIEEVNLRGSRFKDISIKEMHTIDVIGKGSRCDSKSSVKRVDGNSWNCYDKFEQFRA
ncbi:transcription regulator, MarR family [Streptococcus pneumoniae]|nr:transcription regulator, MarR family [Streptococcus pneumoniae]